MTVRLVVIALGLVAATLAFALPRPVAAQTARAGAAPQRTGAQVFAAHCARCHGAQGDGDSAIARVVSPKPPDLRRSRLEFAHMREIVRGGGESVGRSPIMPRWSGEIPDADVESVIAYAFSLRESLDASRQASRTP